MQSKLCQASIALPLSLCLIAFGLSGCGRRGPLESDTSKNAPATMTMNPSASASVSHNSSASPSTLDGTKPASSTSRGVKKPFPLDPLL